MTADRLLIRGWISRPNYRPSMIIIQRSASRWENGLPAAPWCATRNWDMPLMTSGRISELKSRPSCGRLSVNMSGLKNQRWRSRGIWCVIISAKTKTFRRPFSIDTSWEIRTAQSVSHLLVGLPGIGFALPACLDNFFHY